MQDQRAKEVLENMKVGMPGVWGFFMSLFSEDTLKSLREQWIQVMVEGLLDNMDVAPVRPLHRDECEELRQYSLHFNNYKGSSISAIFSPAFKWAAASKAGRAWQEMVAQMQNERGAQPLSESNSVAIREMMYAHALVSSSIIGLLLIYESMLRNQYTATKVVAKDKDSPHAEMMTKKREEISGM